MSADAARMTDFDAFIIPGGHAPDRIRLRHAMVDAHAELGLAKLIARLDGRPRRASAMKRS